MRALLVWSFHSGRLLISISRYTKYWFYISVPFRYRAWTRNPISVREFYSQCLSQSPTTNKFPGKKQLILNFQWYSHRLQQIPLCCVRNEIDDGRRNPISIRTHNFLSGFWNRHGTGIWGLGIVFRRPERGCWGWWGVIAQRGGCIHTHG